MAWPFQKQHYHNRFYKISDALIKLSQIYIIQSSAGSACRNGCPRSKADDFPVVFAVILSVLDWSQAMNSFQDLNWTKGAGKILQRNEQQSTCGQLQRKRLSNKVCTLLQSFCLHSLIFKISWHSSVYFQCSYPRYYYLEFPGIEPKAFCMPNMGCSTNHGPPPN